MGPAKRVCPAPPTFIHSLHRQSASSSLRHRLPACLHPGLVPQPAIPNWGPPGPWGDIPDCQETFWLPPHIGGTIGIYWAESRDTTKPPAMPPTASVSGPKMTRVRGLRIPAPAVNSDLLTTGNRWKVWLTLNWGSQGECEFGDSWP